MAENTPLKDSELTPEQLKKREKNRRKNAARKARKAKDAQQVKENNTNSVKQATPDAEKPAEKDYRQIREERKAERFNRKSSKLENNADDAVVVVAESIESRAIAFPLDEINRITENIRRNMGSERISFETGIDLLSKFQQRVQSNLELFIELAHANNIGSKYAIRQYDEEKAKKDKRMTRSMQSETPEEAKEREVLDKALEKATDAVEKQYEALEKAKETYKKALEDVDLAARKRIEAGEQRAREAKEAEREAKKAEREALKAKKDAEAEKAKETSETSEEK